MFKDLLGLYLKFGGCTRGLYRTSPEQPLELTTVSHFGLYELVRKVVKYYRSRGVPSLVRTNVSDFGLCVGLYEGCAGVF